MTDAKREETRAARLERLVAAYGADVERWPPAERALAPDRDEMASIAGAAEADALDRLIGIAARSKPLPAAPDLIESILAKTTPTAAARAATARGEADAAGAASNEAALHERPARPMRAATYRGPAAAAALMAASLAVGLFVGSLQTTQSTVARISTLAGLEIGAMANTGPFEEDFLGQDEEDIL